jgi:signal transduction histidine kinase
LDVSRADRVAFRAAFALYAAGLLGWLVLGLLPTLAVDVPPVHQVLDNLAGNGGAIGRFASRILHPDMAMMNVDVTSGWQATLQYGFSVLNLALGLLLVARRPDERVPRLLAFALLGTAATFNLPSHRAFHITGTPWPIALIHFTFHIVSGAAYIWAVVLFPAGRLPRSIRVGRIQGAAVVVLVTVAIALLCWRSSFLAHPQFFVIFFGIAVAVTGVGAQWLRLSDPRTSAAERATARLLCAALLPALVTALLWLGARLLVAFGGSPGAQAERFDTNVQQIFPAVFAIVPVVLFAGVVRYRLWDIDRLLSRMLVYGLIAVAVSALYVAAVASGGWLAGGGLWWTVVALSAAAVVVEPLRVQGRRWANRVVFGQVLSPAEAMQTLVSGLEQVSPAGELDQVVAVAVAATRAAAAELWLLDGDRLECAAREPAWKTGPPEVALGDTDRNASALQAALSDRPCWPVAHQGELLGMLALITADGTPIASADAAVAADIAAHAGLLVHNAMLTVRLARHVAVLTEQSAELRTARRRLVAAQDAERRRLERNLHDGAQQALVAAIIGARACTAQGTASATEIDELNEVLGIARSALTDLSGDGRPAALAPLGLAGALEQAAQLARRSGLDVRIDVRVSQGELAADVEAAVYFCCLEALQNVSKYASASRVTVSVDVVEGRLQFVVVDDGTGFDPAIASDPSGGLLQLAERLTVLGGSLVVGSELGGGAAVRGTVPAREPEPAPDSVPESVST